MSGVRSPVLRKLLAILADAWRERSAERRAARAARPGGPEPRLARSRMEAALDARSAVRAGVRLDDFLRHRLARYAARLPVPLESLPVAIDVEGGEATVKPRVVPRPAGTRAPPPPPAPLAQALVEREGPYATREIRDAEAALDGLDARVASAREHIAKLSRDLADAFAAGVLVARPDIEATAEQLGRPPVPSPAFASAIRGFVVALLGAEAWRFSAPVLRGAGISPDGLAAALRAQPLPAGLGLVFAVGAAAAAFAFAGLAVARAADAVALANAPRKRALLVATSVAAALAAGAIAAAAHAPDLWADVVLLVTVPFAAALAWREAGRLAQARAAALEAALGWDRERAKEAFERGRRFEVLERATAELRAAESERDAARRRLQALQRRAVDADRRAMFAARAEARRLERLAEGLAGALELDRYLFIRIAADRSREAAPRPVHGRLEPAVANERLGIAG